ncbi:MAG TPA: sensor histidine kinase [Acidimicrobiales bacterium]|nr:sensor histidine kinase [Acidimicrobiales bacterium]
MSSAFVADSWRARFDRLGRRLLLPLLLAATGLAAGSIHNGYTPAHLSAWSLAIVSGAVVWTAALGVHPQIPAGQRGRLALFVVHLAFSAVLVWLNPWYGVFAFTTYFVADDLEGRRRTAGFVLTALVISASQCGGYPTGLSLQLLAYLVMAGINLVAISGFLLITARLFEQNQQRGEMISEMAEANRRLQSALAENAGLHAQLLVQAREAGVVEERQRLAGEIHDTLAQGLAGIVAQLEAAEQAAHAPAERARHLAQARALARSSLTEARRSVRALRPEQLEDATLADALGALARTWTARSGVPVEVGTTGAPRRADPDIEAALYRVAQEALTNVAKHAHAGRVHLTLSYLDDTVLLDVSDDGVGLDPAAGGDGYGRHSMQRRLGSVGGSLTVESAPGEGTTVNASVPLVERLGGKVAAVPATAG